jgi:hypothetical protein
VLSPAAADHKYSHVPGAYPLTSRHPAAAEPSAVDGSAARCPGWTGQLPVLVVGPELPAFFWLWEAPEPLVA